MSNKPIILLERYEIKKRIFFYGNSNVWIAKDNVTNEQVIVKEIPFTSKRHYLLYKEALFTNELSSKTLNILNVFWNKKGSDLYIVYENMETTLHLAIKTQIFEEETQQQYIIYQLLLILQYFYSKSVIFTNLTTSNITLNSDCLIKIGNLETYFLFIDSIVENEIFKGKNEDIIKSNTCQWYQSPEILLNSKNLSFSTDIWSLGCIIYELYIGQPLFLSSSLFNQFEILFEFIGWPSDEDIKEFEETNLNYYLKFIKKKEKKGFKNMKINENLINLLERIFILNPKNRISFNDALNHVYFKDFFHLKQFYNFSKLFYHHTHIESDLFEMIQKFEKDFWEKRKTSFKLDQINKLNPEITFQFK